ncbi:MAG: 30S ribosomal protein S3 [Thermoplasmatota archaeon]
MAVERKLIREHKKRVAVREFLHRETERAGFGGAEIQRTPMGTRINLIAERPGFVIGRRGATIKKLTDDLHDRYGLDNPQIEVTEDRNPSLNPHIMAQKLAEALERGWHFRRAGHSTLRRIMDAGAKGCQIKIGGKLTGGRSRVEKFVGGHIKFSGDTARLYMNRGFAVCKKKLGVIGVSVAIMDASVRLPDETHMRAEAGQQADARAAAIAAGQAPLLPPPAPRKPLVGEFTDLEGVGPKKAEALQRAGYTSLDELDEATLDDIAEVEGIGPKLAKTIKDELKRIREAMP